MKFIKEGDRIGAIDYVRREQAGKSMLEHAIEKINAGEVDPFLAEDIVGALTAGMIELDHRITPVEIK
jgi:hypothetical protein